MNSSTLLMIAGLVLLIVIAVLIVWCSRRREIVIAHNDFPQPSANTLNWDGKTGDLEAEVLALAVQGKMFQAIKLVHEQTGWELEESKDYIESLIKQEFTLSPTAAPTTISASTTGTLEMEARALVAQGKTIHAIKLVREQTGWGLKRSNDYVKSLGRHRS